MRAAWPQPDEALDFPADESNMESVMELVRAIRNVRAEMNVPPAKRAKLYLVTTQDKAPMFTTVKAYFERLAGARDVDIQFDKSGISKNAVAVVSAAAEAFIPLEELVDIEKERERNDKEIARVEGDIKRAEGKLNNAGFMAKAPARVIAEEKEKLEAARTMLARLQQRKTDLG